MATSRVGVPIGTIDPAELMTKIFESEAAKAMLEKGEDFEANVKAALRHIHSDINAIKAKVGAAPCDPS